MYVLGLFCWLQSQSRALENYSAEPVCMDIFKKPILKNKNLRGKVLVFRLPYSSIL
jgi:hypothetical protein